MAMSMNIMTEAQHKGMHYQPSALQVASIGSTANLLATKHIHCSHKTPLLFSSNIRWKVSNHLSVDLGVEPKRIPNFFQMQITGSSTKDPYPFNFKKISRCYSMTLYLSLRNYIYTYMYIHIYICIHIYMYVLFTIFHSIKKKKKLKANGVRPPIAIVGIKKLDTKNLALALVIVVLKQGVDFIIAPIIYCRLSAALTIVLWVLNLTTNVKIDNSNV
ncbi:hypothetical protein RFI_19357 [Reticulomyxa filosa]|uniref:Uncharacterized protein n=1 Tax=Reticulomyxa filosa TaxID=46433 RepID=X6MVD9_RETFI|nr:hypothetical protein RFI_19357 [Reticulomyxa filosa]|eukprot:ETO17948.1 hypothetical protein RFI_19357 [Reticulomyxa filosa]